MRAAIFLPLLLLASSAQAQTVSFDAFLAGAEACKHGAAFETFHGDIADKYRNDFGGRAARVNPKVVVRIPPEIAAGIGRARSVNKGEYTEVTVPVTGTWRGLALKEFEFDLGNENGINVWLFRFTASREDVVRVFGAYVAATAKEFKRNPSEAGEFAISIPKGKAAIVCDQSN